MKINNKQSKELALRIKKRLEKRRDAKSNKKYLSLIEIQENGSEKDKVPRG